MKRSSCANLLIRLWRYLALFAKRPADLATLVPSSPILTRKLSDSAAVADAHCVVELGPGDGGTTRALLKSMRSDARLLAVELVGELANVLRNIDDDRCIVEHADACDLTRLMRSHALRSADVIVSGIPFSHLDHDQATRIIDAIHTALAPGGTFVAYQVRDRVSELAQHRFGDPDVCFVPWNLPPVHLYRWTKVSVPAVEPTLIPAVST